MHLSSKKPVVITFAIPDHPWIDEDADVRIAMTIGQQAGSNNSTKTALLGILNLEEKRETPEDTAETIAINWKATTKIFSNLQSGCDVGSAIALKSNNQIACPGMQLCGAGFIVDSEEISNIDAEVVFPYLNGRDFMQKSRNVQLIDLFG